MKPWSPALLAAVCLAVVACGSTAPRTPAAGAAGTLTLTVLADKGPAAVPGNSGPPVLAATSLTDLRSIAAGAGVAGCPSSAARLCWEGVTDSDSTVFMALWLHVACSPSDSVETTLQGASLTVKVDSRGQCPPGMASSATPLYSLVSVPLHALPTGVIQVTLRHLSDGKAVDAINNVLGTSHGVLDLRPPASPQPNAQDRTDQLRKAIALAKTAPPNPFGKRDNWLVEVGTERWPQGDLGCATPPAATAEKETWGYLLVLSNHESAAEYHVSGNQAIFCRSRPDSILPPS